MNKEQDYVIKNYVGPMQLNAVAGSGKTTALTNRVANMLQSSEQIGSDMILALTFTEAAATTMRRKLIEKIGQEAYRINIYTFHGFANDVIQSNPNQFALRDREPVSDIEQVEILKEMVDSLPMDHPLKRYKGDPYYEVYRMKKLFLDMKMENWSSGYIENMANDYINNLYHDDRYIYKRANKKKGISKGDVKEEAINKERERMTQLIAGAKLLPEYNKKLDQNNRLDFSDMISLVIQAFKEDNDFLVTYQEHYQYVLVDEMQDTNGSQFKILRQLISFWDKPNVFIVGDINQSIYGFQGANILNIENFNREFKPEIVSTNINYRSTQDILDKATNVIRNNASFDDELHLIAANGQKGEPVRLYEFDTTIQEEAFILQEIERLQQEGVSLSDIAVLYRKHDQAKDLIDACQRKDMELNVKRRFNVFEHKLIQQIICILQHAVYVKSADKGSPYVFDIMAYRFLGADSSKILDFQLNDTESEEVKQIQNFLSELATQVHNDPPLKVIEKIVDNYIIQDTITDTDRSQSILVLSSFYKFVKNEIFRNPFMDTEDLLNRINNMIDNNIPVPVLDLVAAQGGVTFSTIHGAKGLEWPHVYMLGLTRDKWESNRGNTNKFKLPETITQFEDKEDKEQSERRLFYVGLTRAATNLTLSYAIKDNAKQRNASMFVGETGVEPVHPDNVNIPSYLNTLYKPFIPLELMENKYVKEILEHVRLSVSAVNKYLQCPVSYYFENILRVPFVAGTALVYGNSIHETFKWLYDNSREIGDFPTIEQVQDMFLHRMTRNRGQLNQEDFVRRVELGKQILPEWYEKVFLPSNKITVNEYVIKNNIEGVPVKYVFDKLEFNGNIVDAVDYKTGNTKYISKHLKAGDDTQPGGDYWRQMIVAKILIDKMDKWQFRSARIDMVDDGFNSFPVTIQKDDEKLVKQQFREVYDKVKNMEFDDGCGECKWCKMLKQINE